MYCLRYFVLSTILLFCACSSNNDCNTTESNKSTSIKIDGVNLFIETSASMKGFLTDKGPTKFKRTVLELASELSDKYDKPKSTSGFSVFTISENPVLLYGRNEKI